MELGKVYKNNIMTLRLIKSVNNNAAFEHLINGEVEDYIVGEYCRFDGDSVTWGWGSYNLTRAQAIKLLNK